MYDHFIAFDWAQHNVAIARMTAKASKIQCFDAISDTKEIRIYLNSLKGKKILTIEESSTAQWLYTEFRDAVDELIICNPRRNHLLSEGPKTDRIDAIKLVHLLKGGFLKPVFHSSDQFIYFRKLISGYDDLVTSGVRLKNQRSALFRANGLNSNEEFTKNTPEDFVLQGLNRSIDIYQEEKKRYEQEFERIKKQHQLVANLFSIPGIGLIHSVKLAAIIVKGERFPTRNHFLSYSGLIKLEKISGGKSYGKKNPQYNRSMKNIFKTAAVSVLNRDSNNYFNRYYKYLIKERNYAPYNARHSVARRIAAITLGVFKTGKKFNEKRFTYDLNEK